MAGSHKFINPYNFVPFGKKQVADKEDATAILKSGVIEYTITTKSPLFIPNTSSGHAFKPTHLAENISEEDHQSYDFFSYTDLNMGEYKGKTFEETYFEPVIPGSEIRGAIRNIYETLTGSCMGAFNENERVSIRTSEIFKPGVLKLDGIHIRLYMAEDCILRDEHNKFNKIYEDNSYQEGQKIEFFKQRRNRGKSLAISGIGSTGYILKGMPDGTIGKKHCIHVMVLKENSLVHTFSKAEGQELLETVIEHYQENDTGAYSEYHACFRKFCTGNAEEYFPVYYSQIKDAGKEIVYLSPAAIGRELSNKTLGELEPEFVPCKNKENACPACRLFGMVGESHENAIASKIRFSDATISETGIPREGFSDLYDPLITLEALGQPKLQNIEFYLTKPDRNANFWTYDYYVDEHGNVKLADAKLRGRKFYWHQIGRKLPGQVEQTNLNKTIRPVKTGITFCGRLYYQNITEKQLAQLLCIMNSGNHRETTGYKLGGGKPLGLGSVVFKVTRVCERLIQDNAGIPQVSYREKEMIMYPDYEDQAVGFTEHNGNCVKAFLKIHDLRITDGKEVSYAYVLDTEGEKKNGEGFEWFGLNHDARIMKNSRTKNVRRQILPDLLSDNMLMQAGEEYPQKQRRPEKAVNIGHILEGKVTGYNDKKSAIRVQFADGKKTTVFFKKLVKSCRYGEVDRQYLIGEKIRLKYEGVENGYPQYTEIES